MDETLDIFEILPDGTPRWRAASEGYEAAVRDMNAIAENSRNEFRIVHLPERVVLARRLANPVRRSKSQQH